MRYFTKLTRDSILEDLGDVHLSNNLSMMLLVPDVCSI
jgi:hypothetical protein